MNNLFSLHGKKILITGASSGLGRSIAIECSKMGASVIITGRNKERLQATFDELLKLDNQQIVCDLKDKKSFDDLCRELPQLDGVVMNAGIPCSTPVKYNSDSFMRELFETNTFVNFNLSKFLVKEKKINKKGSIIFITSVAANKAYKGNSIYSASKGAVHSFAKVLALEVANKKIRVNCISPGIIPISKSVLNNVAFSDEDLKEQMNKMPLGFGKSVMIANSSIYLLSDASEWITGINLIVDGGQSL